MRKFFGLLILAVSQFSYAQFFRTDIKNNQVAVLSGEKYVFVGHATSYWDGDKSSQKGTRALVDWGKQNRIPIVATVHSAGQTSETQAKQYYLVDQEVDVVVQSEAGQHKVTFDKAKQIFFAGGNLGLCLCEGIRDAVRNNRTIEGSESLNLYLVVDAIYDWSSSLDPVTKPAVDSFIKSYFIPSFKCPEQNWYNFPQMKLSTLRMDVTFDGQAVGSYDLEPTDANPLESLRHLVNIHFIHSKDLNLYLN